MRKFAEILLPVFFNNGILTYSVPEDLNEELGFGSLVMVKFGKKKFYQGIVLSLSNEASCEISKIKKIEIVLSSKAVITYNQYKLWQFISSYYMCSMGEVMSAALPSALKTSSADKKKLINNGLSESFVRLSTTYLKDKSSFKKSISRSKKKIELLDYFESFRVKEMSKDEFLEKTDCSSSMLKSLIDCKALDIIEKKKEFSYNYAFEKEKSHSLSEDQNIAFNEIKDVFEKKSTCLLHGYTSSGKTEIYIKFIENNIAEEKQVLMLVPEIALTDQLSGRLRKVFGNDMCIYHSRISDKERYLIWDRMMSNNPFKLVLGARSSVFLPFSNLGMIIVDEEHDFSYKQVNPAPRYNARNVGLVLSTFFKAKTLLGSATPSLESYYNVKNSKYGLVNLFSRYKGVEMPLIEIIDLKEQYRKKLMNHSLFSSKLLCRMKEMFSQGRQVLLFQNRRGFSPTYQCKSCGETIKCQNCDVSMTYHKSKKKLVCHYCGAEKDVPLICPSCGSKNVDFKGFGTERIEDEIKIFFPDIPVIRIDTDTTSKKNESERLISDFENTGPGVLVGTQMISKGIDFANVGLVCILNADNVLNLPDFRAQERAFQLFSQVSGRAGRREERGEVLIQCFSPEDTPLFENIINNDFNSFANEEGEIRKLFNYPPFTNLINIHFKCSRKDVLLRVVSEYKNMISKILGNRVQGPFEPLIARVNGLFIQSFVIKLEKDVSASKIKKALREKVEILSNNNKLNSLRVVFDVDPE